MRTLTSRHPAWFRKGLLIFFVVAVAAPGRGFSQAPSARSRARLFAINVALGGVSGGVLRAAQGKSFWKGFVGGSAGGVLLFAGKCSLAHNTPITLWAGRTTAALGSSAIANASEGRPLFQRIVIPLGPFRIYRDNKKNTENVRVNLSGLATATYFGLGDKNSFQLRKSLTHDVVEFESREEGFSGLEAEGVVKLRPDIFPRTIGHELIHVSQDDFESIVLQEPLEEWLLTNAPGGRAIHRHFDLGTLGLARALLSALIPVDSRPWEQEAKSYNNGC